MLEGFLRQDALIYIALAAMWVVAIYGLWAHRREIPLLLEHYWVRWKWQSRTRGLRELTRWDRLDGSRFNPLVERHDWEAEDHYVRGPVKFALQIIAFAILMTVLMWP